MSRYDNGGGGNVKPIPPNFNVKDGEIPVGDGLGGIKGSGMISDGTDLDMDNQGIKHLSPHSIQFGDPVTLTSDGVGMVVKHVNNKKSLALAGCFYDDEGSNGVFYPHYGKRKSVDIQVDDFKTEIITPYIFTADSDMTVYGYTLYLAIPEGKFNNVRYSIKLGEYNKYEKNEQPVLAESVDESQWFKDGGGAGDPTEPTVVTLTNGFLLEQGKVYTLFAEDYDMTTKEIVTLSVGGNEAGVPWAIRDCQHCEIKPIVEGSRFVTGSEMAEMGRKWVEFKDYNPARTIVFNTDLMCYCNLVANLKTKAKFAWYSIDTPNTNNWDEGINDFRFLQALSDGHTEGVSFNDKNYAYRDDLYCWIPVNYKQIDTDLLILGKCRVHPPAVQSKSTFLSSTGEWLDNSLPAPLYSYKYKMGILSGSNGADDYGNEPHDLQFWRNTVNVDVKSWNPNDFLQGYPHKWQIDKDKIYVSGQKFPCNEATVTVTTTKPEGYAQCLGGIATYKNDTMDGFLEFTIDMGYCQLNPKDYMRIKLRQYNTTTGEDLYFLPQRYPGFDSLMYDMKDSNSLIIHLWIKKETLKINPSHSYSYGIAMWQYVASDGSWQSTPRK